jgi:two-component system, response regulator YesN
MRILIVEDEASSRRGLIDLLKSIGPQHQLVGIAGNGEEGLAKLKALSPDVAFVDICMPVMDGLEMVGEARRQGSTTAFIIISAYAEFSYARKALVQGALDYLVKPFTLEDVEDVLRRASVEVYGGVVTEEINVKHPMVTRTLKIISSQYPSHISLESISEQLQITPEYLSYLFKRDTGTNFIIYLRNFRIEKAMLLIQDGKLKIYEVAAAVGFSDAKYFCRVFRNVTGQSPSSIHRDQGDLASQAEE